MLRQTQNLLLLCWRGRESVVGVGVGMEVGVGVEPELELEPRALGERRLAGRLMIA